MHLAAGSGASKKLRRRRPEPGPRSVHVHTVAASCLQRREGLSIKVGGTQRQGGPSSLLTGWQFCMGLWTVPPGPTISSPDPPISSFAFFKGKEFITQSKAFQTVL